MAQNHTKRTNRELIRERQAEMARREEQRKTELATLTPEEIKRRGQDAIEELWGRM